MGDVKHVVARPLVQLPTENIVKRKLTSSFLHTHTLMAGDKERSKKYRKRKSDTKGGN